MIELTAPALFAAGLAGSPHCALMCGPLHAIAGGSPRKTARSVAELHAGRVLGYSALGAIAGALGQAGLSLLPPAHSGVPVQLLAAAVLLVGGLIRLRGNAASCKGACTQRRAATTWLRGLVLAAVPCAMLYATLALATLSGGPVEGALLLAAFGLGTVPLAGGGGLLFRRLRASNRLGHIAGWSLITLAAASAGAALLAVSEPALAAWCAPGLD